MASATDGGPLMDPVRSTDRILTRPQNGDAQVTDSETAAKRAFEGLGCGSLQDAGPLSGPASCIRFRRAETLYQVHSGTS